MLDFVILAMFVLAVSIGYFLGSRKVKRAQEIEKSPRFDKDYFTGLNYLLSEQTDKALDALMQALGSDIDEDTIDTYITLGTFFCKRGEVDRAIQIHQDLLALTTLTVKQAEKVQISLAQDYMIAGMLDRAEVLLTQLAKKCTYYKEKMLTALLHIYELEHNWEKAIRTLSVLKSEKKDYDSILSQYYCEIAEECILKNNLYQARKNIKIALNKSKQCIRAWLLLAKIEADEEGFRESGKALRRAIKQDGRYFPLLIPLMESNYNKTKNLDTFVTLISKCLQEHPTAASILAMTRFIRYKEGADKAIYFLFEELREHPTLKGVNTLLSLQLETKQEMNLNRIELLMDLTSKIIKTKALFKCDFCGLKSLDMHWKCPKCNNWATIAPIEGLEGE